MGPSPPHGLQGPGGGDRAGAAFAELLGSLGLGLHKPLPHAGPRAHSPLRLPRPLARQACHILAASGFAWEKGGCWSAYSQAPACSGIIESESLRLEKTY